MENTKKNEILSTLQNENYDILKEAVGIFLTIRRQSVEQNRLRKLSLKEKISYLRSRGINKAAIPQCIHLVKFIYKLRLALRKSQKYSNDFGDMIDECMVLIEKAKKLEELYL